MDTPTQPQRRRKRPRASEPGNTPNPQQPQPAGVWGQPTGHPHSVSARPGDTVQQPTFAPQQLDTSHQQVQQVPVAPSQTDGLMNGYGAPHARQYPEPPTTFAQQSRALLHSQRSSRWSSRPTRDRARQSQTRTPLTWGPPFRCRQPQDGEPPAVPVADRPPQWPRPPPIPCDSEQPGSRRPQLQQPARRLYGTRPCRSRRHQAACAWPAAAARGHLPHL